VLCLGIDTSSASTSVAVVSTEGILAQVEHVDARRHAEVLPTLVAHALRESGVAVADLGVIACGTGPGPFTGLRVGVAFARSLGQGLDCPVVGVCSLDAVAAQRVMAQGLTVVMRVRRAEVAWATYDAAGHRTAGPLVSRDDDVAIDGPALGTAAPDGVMTYPTGAAVATFALQRLMAGEDVPGDTTIPEGAPDGAGSETAVALMTRSDQGLHLLPALPLYLRRPDAVPSAER